MEKNKKIIREYLRLVDLVIEVCDARAPAASLNPIIQEMIDKQKLSKILVLNKQDLADSEATGLWLKRYAKDENTHTAIISAKNPNTRKTLINFMESFRRREHKNKLIVLICGIPNSGKSTIINATCKRKKTKAGAKPGLTQQVEKIFVSNNLEFIDSPGLLWPKLESHTQALKLSAIGAIKETVLPSMEVLYGLLFYLMQCYPQLLEKHFGIASDITHPDKYMLSIAQSRGYFQSRGEIDYNRMCQNLLRDFRQGRIGCLSFEWPDGRGWDLVTRQ